MIDIIKILSVGILLSACTTDGPISENTDNGTDVPNQPGNSSSNDTSGDLLESFDVTFDKSVLEETAETIPTDKNDAAYDDYVENSSFNVKVVITFSEGGVTVDNQTQGVSVSKDGANVTITSTAKAVEYILNGTTSNGSFKIYSDNKFKITLSGVSITNPVGPAINIQSKKRNFIVCDAGTTNNITDGTAYTSVLNEDMKGCLFSEGQTIFSGSGILNVSANYKNGLCSDDYIRFRKGVNINITSLVGNGIKTNDCMFLDGGVINVEVKGNGAKGLSTDGYMQINGGRTMILTSGGGVFEDNDVTGCAGIKCDSILTINGGIIGIKSTGDGGKGISCDQNMFINDGTVKVITTGSEYIYGKYNTSSKGIKSDANITINGGNILVKTNGGEGSEGIESKNIMKIAGGNVLVSSYDDCLNASSNITVTGGNIYAYSSANDGIDSNGTMNISGGVIVTSGTQVPEEGLDCDQNTFIITGGIVVGVGGATSTPTASKCTQPTIIYGGSGNSGNYISLADSNGNNVLIYKIPRNYSQMTLLVSSPLLSKNSTYTLSSGGTLTGGTEFHGLYTGGTYKNGTSLASITLKDMVTTSGTTNGGNGGGMGGNPPGGGWGW